LLEKITEKERKIERKRERKKERERAEPKNIIICQNINKVYFLFCLGEHAARNLFLSFRFLKTSSTTVHRN
jgi:hypothetical protein